MNHTKARLFSIVMIVVAIGLVYVNWQQLLHEHKYSMKLAAFAPVCGVGGLFLLLFPGLGGKPTTAREKLVVLPVFVVGLLAGLVNWYLMDPGYFGR